MKNGVARVFVLIFGILMVILGCVLFATPGTNSLILAYVVCFLMVVYGIAEIAYYVSHRKGHIVSGWVLADGIITVILGILLLFIPSMQILTMSIVFAVWVLFTGVTRTASAFSAMDMGVSNWGWSMAAGVIGILLGIWLLCDPLLAIMSIGFLVPLAFIMEGISGIATFFATGEK